MADDDAGDDDDAGGEDPQAADVQGAQQRPTRQQLKKATKDRLSDTGDLMVAGDHNAEIVVSGGNERSLGALGKVFSRLEALLDNLEESSFRVSGLAILESIHITLEPAPSEIQRARETMAKAQELEEDDPRRERLVREAVPATFVAAEMAIDLIEAADRNEPVETILAYGREAAETLRSLSRLLADEGLALAVTTTLDERHVEQTDEQLERIARRLEQLGDIETFNVRVAGVVTMADSDEKKYRLKVADDTGIPPALRNVRNRRVSGPYTANAGRVLREQGLWNQEVVATIRVERQKRHTSAKRRPPKYTLVGAKRRFD